MPLMYPLNIKTLVSAVYDSSDIYVIRDDRFASFCSFFEQNEEFDVAFSALYGRIT